MLVGIETARAALGVDAEEILARIEEGRLRWAWDISVRTDPARRAADTNVRELRLWVRELIAPDWCMAFGSAEVVARVLGQTRHQWRAAEVAQLLLCSRSVVKRLVDAGELAGPIQGRARWITRDSLASFLQRRLLGWQAKNESSPDRCKAAA